MSAKISYYYCFAQKESLIGLNPSRPNPRQKERINLNFIFTLLCGTSKGYKEVRK